MKTGIIKGFFFVIAAMAMLGLANRLWGVEAVSEESREPAEDEIKQLEARVAALEANLEGDVKNINGRDRDDLLTAWHKHTFKFGEAHSLGITGGNTGLQRVQVAEVYYRFAMNDWLAMTGDVQYQDNEYEDVDADADIDAWTWGMRAVVEF